MHPFSTPWKHQKTVRFSDVFRRQRKGALGTNRLKCVSFRDLLQIWLEIQPNLSKLICVYFSGISEARFSDYVSKVQGGSILQNSPKFQAKFGNDPLLNLLVKSLNFTGQDFRQKLVPSLIVTKFGVEITLKKQRFWQVFIRKFHWVLLVYSS